MAGDGAVDTEHINVVAEDLKVVAGVVARGASFVVQHGAFGIGCHLQVATKAGRRPRGVACVAGHRVVGVRELRSLGGNRGEWPAGLAHQLCAIGFWAEVHVAGRDRIAGLNDVPL